MQTGIAAGKFKTALGVAVLLLAGTGSIAIASAQPYSNDSSIECAKSAKLPDSDPASPPDSDPASPPDSDPASQPDNDPASQPDNDPACERREESGG